MTKINSKNQNCNDYPTLISLFAGAGGLDIGLEEAGFKALVLNELEPHACQTLESNKTLSLMSKDDFERWFNQQLNQRCYKNISKEERDYLRERISLVHRREGLLQHASIIRGDIRKIKSHVFIEASGMKPGQVALVAGGPPCQPFSRAGKRQNVEVDDGQLFLEFVRVVKDIQPRWFLFENVKGLGQTKTTVLEYICHRCRKVGPVPFILRRDFFSGQEIVMECQCGNKCSDINQKTISGGSLDIIVSEFERIGYTCHVKLLNSADYGVPQFRERLFIVGSRDNELFQWPGMTHADTPANRIYNTAIQCSIFDSNEQLRPYKTVIEVLWPNGHPIYGPIDPDSAVLWVKNVVRPHDEPVTWDLRRPAPTVGAHQAAKLAIAPYGVPEEQLYRQQWHVLGRRQGDTPPVKVEHAYLSDEELLALQTFPKFWYLFGTRMERAFQIGNAVPVNLARVVGESILKSSGLNFMPKNLGTMHEAANSTSFHGK